MNYKQAMSKCSKRIKDSDDNWHDFSEADKQLAQSDPDGVYYVIARDKFMSGWGLAEGRNSYMVVVCWSWEQMKECERLMSNAKEMRNVRTSTSLPKRLNGKVDFYNFDEATRFSKYYFSYLERNPLYDRDILPHDAEYSQNIPDEFLFTSVHIENLENGEEWTERSMHDGVNDYWYNYALEEYSQKEGQYKVSLMKELRNKKNSFIEGSYGVMKSQVVGLGASGAGEVADSRKVSDAKRGKDIFTIEIFNDTQEEDITPWAYANAYYNIDEAIADVEELIDDYRGESDTIYGWVFAGEYETESGDIFGEPDVVYSVSNKDKKSGNDFKPTGGMAYSNAGGMEVEISSNGEEARFRMATDKYGEVSDWYEIQFEYDDDDEDGDGEARPYCDTKWGREYLDEYMKY